MQDQHESQIGQIIGAMYAMDGSIASPSLPVILKTHEWEVHFWKIQALTRFDVPEPCVWRKRFLGLRGGIKPKHNHAPPVGKEWVYLKRGEYILAKSKDVKPPSQKVYDLYFRDLYENNTPYLVTKSIKHFKDLDEFFCSTTIAFGANKRQQKKSMAAVS